MNAVLNIKSGITELFGICTNLLVDHGIILMLRYFEFQNRSKLTDIAKNILLGSNRNERYQYKLNLLFYSTFVFMIVTSIKIFYLSHSSIQHHETVIFLFILSFTQYVMFVVLECASVFNIQFFNDAFLLEFFFLSITWGVAFTFCIMLSVTV